MAKFKFTSHHKVAIKGAVGYKEDPYLSLKHGDDPQILVQGGKYFGAGGEEVDEDKVPSWVKDQVRNLTPDARESVGLPRRLAGKPHESVTK